jgi:uncharacterized protein YegP (UPF0339 family)
MSFYRIKIEEKNNGEKRYIPQVGTPKLKTGRTIWLYTNWENILTHHNRYIALNGMTESYNTEQEALNVIESFKKNILEEDGNKVKSTTYKTID